MNDNDEEITLLKEELDGARAELEALQTTVADREARALHLESQLASAREELSAARQDIEKRDEELGTQRVRSDTLEPAVRSSAERYRGLAPERSPELPEELVTGETVSKVRGHLEMKRSRRECLWARPRVRSRTSPG